MPSRDLQAEAVAWYTEHRESILAAAGVGVLLVFVLLLFGGFRAVGGLLFLGNALVWLAVVAVVLWLLYRFVTAVERIAAAQERIASARDHETVRTAAAAESDTAEPAADEFTTSDDEFPPGVGGDPDQDG